ncbi:MAG TPA: hypothetical protein GX715_07950 [Armatimonadetes bacterium]|nr:hypothetical protein [Armatimonadota bacterium]
MPDTKPDRCGEWCCAEKVAGILALDPVAMTYHVEVSFPEALAAWERLGEYNEWNTERAERLLRGIDRLIPKDTGYGHARRQFALRIGREYSRVLYVSFEPLLFERVGCKVLGRRPHWELADDEPLPASIDGRDEE